MNTLKNEILNKANEAAIYNLYLYLTHIKMPENHQSLQSIMEDLDTALMGQNTQSFSDRDIYRLSVLKNALKYNKFITNSVIRDFTYRENGLTACSFVNTEGDIFVVFKGTGGGEWIDNGEGLSGIPQENTYITYGANGRILYRKTEKNDYATEQQAEALNWFNSIASKNGWNNPTKITLTGHSKGGNKAQFVSINSDLASNCFSFDGQGFSPEAIASFKNRYGANFQTKAEKIYSFSTDNDYVNVLGERLMPETQIYYFESWLGIHYMEALLSNSGNLNNQCEQGELSEYIESVSEELMKMKPFIRQYVTLGVMNIFQKYLGEGTPLNGDSVTAEKTIAGIGLAIGILLRQLNSKKAEEQ